MKVIEKPWGKLLVNEETGEQTPIIKHRRLFVVDEDFSLSPDTMVGSAFHVVESSRIIWQGVVVAEPQAGRYLCELEQLEDGAAKVQRLFSLDTLMGLGDEGKRLIEGAIGESKAPMIDPTIEWRLYDSELEAKEAFIVWTNAQNQRELEASLREEV